ncbi:MAG: hypothetical protein Q9228_007045 [Teloschistes exilis]
MESSRPADAAHESPETVRESGDDFIARERDETEGSPTPSRRRNPAGLKLLEWLDESEQQLEKLEQSLRQLKEQMASISISVSNFEEKVQDLQLDLNVFSELDDNYVRSRLRFLATYVKEHRKDQFTPKDQRTIDETSASSVSKKCN